MKKLFYTLSLVLPIVAALSISNAGAKDRMEKMEKWYGKEVAEINEDYHEAINKIKHADFNEDQKKVLNSQADSNKELALKQAKEKQEQMNKNWQARKVFKNQDMKDGKKEKCEKCHKAFKEIDDIL